MKHNLFITLERYTSSPENYLTEAFVYLLRYLLEHDKAAGFEVINGLLAEGQRFNDNESIEIETQYAIGEGRPDILIRSDRMFVFVEVKRDWLLPADQLGPYKRALEARPELNTCLVLLTRASIEYQDEARPDRHVYWEHIRRSLCGVTARITNPISGFLCREFIAYLEVTRMALNKVSWEYEKGVLALNDLMSILEFALKQSGKSIFRFSSTWTSKGYYVGSASEFCGISFDRPAFIQYEKYEGNKTIKVGEFDLDKSGFFCQSAAGQVDMLEAFVKALQEK